MARPLRTEFADAWNPIVGRGNTRIRTGHGPLGAVYPLSGAKPKIPGVIEGGSPSLLHLVRVVRGLNSPEKPDQTGWGGQFVRRDPARNPWFDHPAGGRALWQWRREVQEDEGRILALPPPGLECASQPRARRRRQETLTSIRTYSGPQTLPARLASASFPWHPLFSAGPGDRVRVSGQPYGGIASLCRGAGSCLR